MRTATELYRRLQEATAGAPSLDPSDESNNALDRSAGLSLAEILAEHPQVARRTAQRWLARLVDENRIVATGEGRARRYLAVQTDAFDAANAPSETGASLDRIPLGDGSREVLAYVDQPVAARHPIGYQREFLSDYEPNRTWYLPAPLRRQLRHIGNTGKTPLPAGTYGRDVLSRLLIDLSWASSNLEGNTYSWLDTQRLLEQSEVATGKAAAETQMILNHKAAIELLVDNAEVVAFDHFTLLNLHSALGENLLPNAADEGRLRRHVVEIGGSVYRPLDVPAQIEEMFDMVLDKVSRIDDPFEQSFFALVHLPYLQPFADVNRRTARLAANLPLIRANLCPLTFLDVSARAYSCAVLGVYEMTRIDLLRDLYLWAYERSTQAYLAVKRDSAEPDPLRLAYREAIKSAVRAAVKQPALDAADAARSSIEENVADADKEDVEALVFEELKRLHEGVLARYGLQLADYARWREQRNVRFKVAPADSTCNR